MFRYEKGDGQISDVYAGACIHLEAPMKTVKIFKQDNSQAVRLPRGFHVDDDELLIKKSGDSIVLTPKGKTRWKNLKAGIAMFRGTIERRQPRSFR